MLATICILNINVNFHLSKFSNGTDHKRYQELELDQSSSMWKSSSVSSTAPAASPPSSSRKRVKSTVSGDCRTAGLGALSANNEISASSRGTPLGNDCVTCGSTTVDSSGFGSLLAAKHRARTSQRAAAFFLRVETWEHKYRSGVRLLAYEYLEMHS